MVVFVVKQYAVREAKKWRYAVRKAKIGRYAVHKAKIGRHAVRKGVSPSWTASHIVGLGPSERAGGDYCEDE